MSIEISENTVGIWAVDLMNGSDFLGSVWREGDRYILEYRFRYYVDNETFDSKDKKNWQRMEVPTDRATEEQMIRAMRTVVEALWKGSGGKRYETLIGPGGAKQVMADMTKWPSISVMKLTAAEAEERGL